MIKGDRPLYDPKDMSSDASFVARLVPLCVRLAGIELILRIREADKADKVDYRQKFALTTMAAA
jgi:hypothetical protein